MNLNQTRECDLCDKPARWTISGYYAAHFLCSVHAARLCESVGDTVGRDKFNAHAEAEVAA